MGARAIIGYVESDERTRYTYALSDGYLSHTGETLMEHHNRESAALAIVSLGTIAAIQEKLGDRPLRMTESQYWLESYDEPDLRRITYVYHRDRSGVDWSSVPAGQVLMGYTREQLADMDIVDDLHIYEASGGLRGFSERMLSVEGYRGDAPDYAYLYVGEKVHSDAAGWVWTSDFQSYHSLEESIERMYRDARTRERKRPSSTFREPKARFSDTIPPHTRMRGENRPPPPNLLSDADYELMEKLATPWGERGSAPPNLFDYATGMS